MAIHQLMAYEKSNENGKVVCLLLSVALNQMLPCCCCCTFFVLQDEDRHDLKVVHHNRPLLVDRSEEE